MNDIIVDIKYREWLSELKGLNNGNNKKQKTKKTKGI